MDRLQITIATSAICVLQVFGVRHALGQDQARLFDDVDAKHAIRERVDVHGPSGLEAFGRVPLAFVENRGQFDARARFVAHQGGLTAHFTPNAFVLQLVSHGSGHVSPAEFRRCAESRADAGMCGANVFFTFVGASQDAVVEGVGSLPGRYNYFLGNDPARWRTNVPGYSSIHYRDLYPGVDVEVRECEDRLEYD